MKKLRSGSPALEHPARQYSRPALAPSCDQTADPPLRFSREEAPLPSDRTYHRTGASVYGLQRLLVMEPSAVPVMPGGDTVAPQAQRRSHVFP
jgi:hypothetical protein